MKSVADHNERVMRSMRWDPEAAMAGAALAALLAVPVYPELHGTVLFLERFLLLLAGNLLVAEVLARGTALLGKAFGRGMPAGSYFAGGFALGSAPVVCTLILKNPEPGLLLKAALGGVLFVAGTIAGRLLGAARPLGRLGLASPLLLVASWFLVAASPIADPALELAASLLCKANDEDHPDARAEAFAILERFPPPGVAAAPQTQVGATGANVLVDAARLRMTPESACAQGHAYGGN